MAVTWAGRCLNPCFDWTSVRRRSLAGTEVLVVPKNRPASLENYCFHTTKSCLKVWRKPLLEALRATARSLGSLYLFSGRGKCHGHALAVRPRCFHGLTV